MKPNKLMGVMAVGLILPSTAIALGDSVLANEIRVKTPNVGAISRNDGSIYVNTGGTTLNVPRRNSRRSWNPFRYWRLPWQSLSHDQEICRHSSYQSTQQTTQSGSRIVQQSSYSNNCN